MRHGDLVGIEGVGIGPLQWLIGDELELEPVVNVAKAGPRVVRDGLVDESVHDSPHPWGGLDGQENDRVDVEWTWSFAIGGDEPIEVDPHHVPDHGIDFVGQVVPELRPVLMNAVSVGGVSEISDGGPGPFDSCGTRWCVVRGGGFGCDVGGIVTRCSPIIGFVTQTFVGSERVVAARVFVGHESAMSALRTGLVRFVKTPVMNEFPATGHPVTSLDGSNV